MATKNSAKTVSKGSSEDKVEVVDGRAEGVLLGATKAEHYDAALEKLNLPTTGGTAAKVARLVRHFRANHSESGLGDCNACGGSSDLDEAEWPRCPYCGEEGGIVDEAPSPVKIPTPSQPAEPTASEVVEPGEKAKPAATAKKAVPVKPKATSAISQTTASFLEAYTVADLDNALLEVEKAKQGQVGSYWDLGKVIHEIHAKKLYLQRRGKGDKPLYETWGQFCEAELGMSGSNSYRIMDVAAKCDRETAVKVGLMKLNAALRIDDPTRRMKLIESAEKLTLKEFEAKVSEVVAKEQGGKAAERGRLTPAQVTRNEKGLSKVAAAKSEGKAANTAKPAVAEDPREKVTAALALGKVSVRLFVKGEKIANPEAKRAKRLADGPHGLEETVNGVTSRYTITTDAKGFLVLTIERKRVS